MENKKELNINMPEQNKIDYSLVQEHLEKKDADLVEMEIELDEEIYLLALNYCKTNNLDFNTYINFLLSQFLYEHNKEDYLQEAQSNNIEEVVTVGEFIVDMENKNDNVLDKFKLVVNIATQDKLVSMPAQAYEEMVNSIS